MAKSHVTMTVNGKSFAVFRVGGGDLMADAIPAKPGQPLHLGPTRHEPLRIAIDADGIIALKPASDSTSSRRASLRTVTTLHDATRASVLAGLDSTGAISTMAAISGSITGSAACCTSSWLLTMAPTAANIDA